MQQESKQLTLYDTGIQVKPPAGFYLEILPRSSLSKTGYILANSVGIIDPDYRGSLLIALMKVDRDMPDIDVSKKPKLCQLVLRRQYEMTLTEHSSLDQTERGDKGFGSTDNS